MVNSQVRPRTRAQAPRYDNVYQAALEYLKSGLSILPLKGKRPALNEWKQYQKYPAPESHVYEWSKRGLLENVGIICGKVSKNLVVLDFDGIGAYGAFAAQYSSLAQTYTVRTGSGQGKHVYLFVNRLPPTTRAIGTPIGNIELRAEGCYIVAPPSLHPVTQTPYDVEQSGGILHVEDIDDVVAWIEKFRPLRQEWQPPRDLPASDTTINPKVIEAITNKLRASKHKTHGDWINHSCIHPERHTNRDQSPSFGFNIRSGFAHCYRCGSMLAKEICESLGINPTDLGGLIQPSPKSAVTLRPSGGVPASSLQSPPPAKPLSPIGTIALPDWLNQYVEWAAKVGNQTPILFHQAAGIWLLSVAIARRLNVEAPWGVKIFPNLFMMLVADTTFYRKTTAYKLAESVIRQAVPHMLMPTPGSPERLQEALAGRLPTNYKELTYEQQELLSKARGFAAQRGLFKDEVAGLFGAFNRRDYMAGMKDLIMELYDCPDYSDKDTQTGLTIVKDAALSILGVTTPAGLASSVTDADWANGLLPRFLLLTPEPEYAERPTLKKYVPAPMPVIEGLKSLYDRLPMPEQAGDTWKSPNALTVDAQCWDEVEAYSNRLRQLCDPNRDTPLDDRLKGVYGRMHVQAVKLSMILATLDWMKTDNPTPIITMENWKTAEAITEQWRVSAHRLLETLDRSGSGRDERRQQDRVYEAIRTSGSGGIALREVYRALTMKSLDARQCVQELLKAGLIAPVSVGKAEGYAATCHLAEQLSA